AAEIWEEFETFIGNCDLICIDASTFEPWRAALRSREAAEEPAFSRGATLALCELAALCFPGRLANLREGLVPALLEETPGRPSRAIEPEEVRDALTQLTRRFLTQDFETLSLAVRGFEKVRVGFATNGAFDVARRISLALKLLDRPANWTVGALGLPQGLVQEALDLEVEFSEIVSLLDPRCAKEIESQWGSYEKLPPADEHAAPMTPQLLDRMDEVFEKHLPAVFAEESGKPIEEISVRQSQHEVAKNVARTLGSKELLLVHAPTGTGKTLAYLVPALLFAQSNGLRVGVATYTRTLQEQAMDREVPRALKALARAGHPGGARISMLKGRENYVCWRALKLEEPDADDEPEAWLAWISVVLFAAHDLD
ncbi:MAG: DEAD/DEAH box helicase, partial [Planctomycetota bacterium]